MLNDNKYHSVVTKDKKESYKYSQSGEGRRVVGKGKCGWRLEKEKQWATQTFISRALQAEGTAMPKSPEKSVKEH